MAEIIEESENTKLERVATVTTKRGEEYIINVDKAICALADLFSDWDNEHRMGWSLGADWYVGQLQFVAGKAKEPQP